MVKTSQFKKNLWKEIDIKLIKHNNNKFKSLKHWK